VVIDVQNYFVPGYPGAISAAIPGQNESKKLENVLSLVLTAKRNEMNTLITYEGSDKDSMEMPDFIRREIPDKKVSQFIKAYFDITKKLEVIAALDKAGTKNIVVCGAETDVCVLQSVTGLIKKGYRVYLAEDAVFTSTTLNEPALKRMQMAGAKIVKTREVIRAIENSDVPEIENNFRKMKDVPDIDVDKIAVVIINYEDESLEKVSDPKKEQKKERIKYLNHYAEVLAIPVYYLYNGSIEKVKKNMYLPSQVQFLKADRSYQKSCEELAASLGDKKISQAAIGGVDENGVVRDSASILKRNGLEVHLMEDVYFKNGGTEDHRALDRLYHSGVVPSSFKILIYDAAEGIQSVLKKRQQEMFKAKLDKKEIVWVEELSFVKDSQ
jgi:nicotinamidase-related amidase